MECACLPSLMAEVAELNSDAFGQGELLGRKHSPAALTLLLPREQAVQNKTGHFKLIICAKTSSLGFEVWGFV